MDDNDDLFFTEEKTRLLRELTTSRNNLKLYQKCLDKFGRQWYETIELERAWFKQLSEELIELKRNRRVKCKMISK